MGLQELFAAVLQLRKPAWKLSCSLPDRASERAQLVSNLKHIQQQTRSTLSGARGLQLASASLDGPQQYIKIAQEIADPFRKQADRARACHSTFA